MRIIGGTFKGVKIFEAFDKNTRPLKDIVKESENGQIPKTLWQEKNTC